MSEMYRRDPSWCINPDVEGLYIPDRKDHSTSEHKHNGVLGEPFCKVHYDNNLIAPWDDENTETYHGIRISVPYNYMPLTPVQALSLLDWLRQEEENLHKMLQEQA